MIWVRIFQKTSPRPMRPGKFQHEQFWVDKMGKFMQTDLITLFLFSTIKLYQLLLGLIESVFVCLNQNPRISFIIVKCGKFKIKSNLPLKLAKFRFDPACCNKALMVMLKKLKSLDQGSNDIYFFLYFLNVESLETWFSYFCLFLLLCIKNVINKIYMHSQ